MRPKIRLPVHCKTSALNLTAHPSMARKKMWLAAQDIVTTLQELSNKGSQVALETIGKNVFVEWEHYPHDDVRDNSHHTQYFYHAHQGKQRPFAEHGHFHCFVHAQELGLRPTTTRYEEAPAHLVAISIDANGMPAAIFIVNRWVTKGPWLSYQECERALQDYTVKSKRGSSKVHRFISAFVTLYHDAILDLIQVRDRSMQKLCEGRDRRSVFADTDIEVICYRPIHLLDDIQALEATID